MRKHRTERKDSLKFLGEDNAEKFRQRVIKEKTRSSAFNQGTGPAFGLPEAQLEAMEKGSGDLPTFDICYRLGQVISSHSTQLFVLQDLWQALKADKLETSQPT
jgi:hypothetical protein